MCLRFPSRTALLVVVVAATMSCRREERQLRPEPLLVALPSTAGEQVARNPYSGVAFSISEGQRLFGWYNCSGCHARGGGGIGPPLIKSGWIYGGSPEVIFESIAKGRPNGMPAWGDRLPAYQIWQIVAFIEALNGTHAVAAPARRDALQDQPNRYSGTRGERR